MTRTLTFDTPEKLQSAIDSYFDSLRIEIDGKFEDGIPLISGLAYHLDICTQTLINYEKREPYFAIVKRAKQRVEMYYERALMDKNTTTGSIFNLKCNHRWVDRQYIESNQTHKLLTEVPIDDLRDAARRMLNNGDDPDPE